MKRSVLMLLLAALSGLLWAANDAAVLPSPGVAAAPTTDKLFTATDAITIPRMLSYQGKLTDSLGNSVPDGDYQLTFRLYTQETGGSPFWTEEQTVAVKNGLFSALLGLVNPISSVPDAGNLYLSLQVGTGSELTPRLRIVSSAYAFLTERAENADLLQGNDTTALDSRYVNEGQANSITSAMIVNGTIVRADVAANFKAPYSDTADYAKAAPAVDSARVAANAHKLQGKDTTGFVRTGQANSITSAMITDSAVGTADIANNAITSVKIADTNVTLLKIQRAGAATGQVIKWTGSAWAPRNDSIGQGDNAWVRGTPDSVLFTINYLGIARGGTNNQLLGAYRYTHINFGNSCTTGTNGDDYVFCTVAGGAYHKAGGDDATVSGGRENRALNAGATVSGGYQNIATAISATVSGGEDNTANGGWSIIGGGKENTTSYSYTTVSGGYQNTASNNSATVGGGDHNTASGWASTIGGGQGNMASAYYATIAGGNSDTARAFASGVLSGRFNIAGDETGDTAAVIAGGQSNRAIGKFSAIGGGQQNTASGWAATIAGGNQDTVIADYGGVLSGYRNKAGDEAIDTAATVAGGRNNRVTAKYGFVGGGIGNSASNFFATVDGGSNNTASETAATVAGGLGNRASGSGVFVGGGLYSMASGNLATVAGGYADSAVAHYGGVLSGYRNKAGDEAIDTAATVAGGRFNLATGLYSFVGGGYGNTASGARATVAGGYSNTASGARATVGGGYADTASGDYATVGGGYGNTASGDYATVGGGYGNTASGYGATVAGGRNNMTNYNYATVGGGYGNTASDEYATVGGGYGNTANGARATVAGGYSNTASGFRATVGGGYADTCAGDYGFACGYRTRVKDAADYTFAFGENCSTSTTRAVVFYHSGGTTKLGVGVQNPTHNIDVQGGAYCNGTNWVNASSRRLKKDIKGFTPEELRAVLEELMHTQVVRYRYKSDESGEEHIGVIAEEAPELLATPERDGINTGDAIGFLLAAVQAVYEENKELRQELEALKTQLQKGR